MMVAERWLSIIGIGEDGWNGLNDEAKRAVQLAEFLYGGARHLDLVPAAASLASRVSWPSPMASALQLILAEYRGKKSVAVLASGDPMLYGVGVPLTRDLAADEFRVIPHISAFSLACARLGWPVAETNLVSLVSRPIEHLHRHLYRGQRLIVLSEHGGTPLKVAQWLTQAGFGDSRLHVFENLGGPSERHTSRQASVWLEEQFSDLNLMAIFCVPDATSKPLSLTPGLPDDAFETDGQLSNREIRAVTLARLAPLPGQILWDIGAGTGTIGIEWMRFNPSCTCVAFEAREDRAVRIRSNAARLGVPSLQVILGEVPRALIGLPSPDAIFIGGSV